jgi:hypothetical protein
VPTRGRPASGRTPDHLATARYALTTPSAVWLFCSCQSCSESAGFAQQRVRGYAGTRVRGYAGTRVRGYATPKNGEFHHKTSYTKFCELVLLPRFQQEIAATAGMGKKISPTMNKSTYLCLS